MQGNADEIWKFQRYSLVEEYDDFPLYPPPFNLIYYFVAFIKRFVLNFIRAKVERRASSAATARNQPDYSGDASLVDAEETRLMIKKIRDLERKYSDVYLRDNLVAASEMVHDLLRQALEK